MPEIGETWVNDGPDDDCFGCGQRNERGLRLAFTRTGEHTVESRYEVEPWYAGPKGVVHGGIQAALLDEVLGATAICAFARDRAKVDVVTADFRLRYRRPCPVGEPLVLEGRVQRVEGASAFVEGEIRNAAGEVVTVAEARWRRLDA